MSLENCRRVAGKVFGKSVKNVSLAGWKAYSPCSVDFQDEDVRSDVSNVVGCEDRCEGKFEWLEEKGEEEIRDCVKECEEEVEIRTTGSVVFHPDTLGIEEATIPLSCSRFVDEHDIYGQSVNVEGKEAKRLLRKLEKLGCRGMTTDWMHPHEFVRGEEWEEDPGVCYVHIKSAGRHYEARGGLPELGRCRVDQVMREVYR